jgi:hypothetical protein
MRLAAFGDAEAKAARFRDLQMSLLRGRAEMELSQAHYSEARTLIARAASLESAPDQRYHWQLTSILGRALVGSGERSRGLQLCRESAASAASGSDALKARLWLAEALAAADRLETALKLFAGHEPDPDRYPESRFRALTLMARADRRFEAAAREALDNLGRSWGDDVVRVYLKRPDIERLANPVFGPTKH